MSDLLTPEERAFVEVGRDNAEHNIKMYSGSEYEPDDNDIVIMDLISIIDRLAPPDGGN